MSSLSLDSDDYRDAVGALSELVDVKCGSVRPVCNLVSPSVLVLDSPFPPPHTQKHTVSSIESIEVVGLILTVLLLLQTIFSCYNIMIEIEEEVGNR